MEAAAWIEAYRCFWEERLDALESYLLEQGDERRQEGASP